MKNQFSKTELTTRIYLKNGEGKNKAALVEQMLKLQNSSEDGRIEFEGKYGTYLFTKKDNVVRLDLPNGNKIIKHLQEV